VPQTYSLIIVLYIQGEAWAYKASPSGYTETTQELESWYFFCGGCRLGLLGLIGINF